MVALLALWSPVIKGHGIPESLEAIVLRESRIKPRALLAKPLSAAVAMGTGGPFGAEGTVIVTGGSIGSLLGQVLPVSVAERRILLATGAAAGMAGVFDTPVAAVLVAVELLLFERSLRGLLPLVLATSLAAELHTVLLGAEPDVNEVVVTDNAEPMGVIARGKITEVLGHRLGESAIQPPTLRWQPGAGRPRWTRLRSTQRIRRVEETQPPVDPDPIVDADPADRLLEHTTGGPSTTADNRPSSKRLARQLRDPEEAIMDRTIVGFHRDTEGDWVAELDCGHNQHVRHRPPFQMRPWVVDDSQRAGHLSTPLPCTLCERAEMPEGLRLAQTSPRWDEHSLPSGLRSAHALAIGTWGRLHLEEGSIEFRAGTTPPIDRVLHAGAVQEIPPGVEHEVEPIGHVRLFIEFFHVVRHDAGHPDDRGHDSTLER